MNILIQHMNTRVCSIVVTYTGNNTTKYYITEYLMKTMFRLSHNKEIPVYP